MVSIFSRRVIAYIIDFFVVSAFMWIVSYLISLVMGPNNPVYHYFIYVVPILIMIYFVLCEKIEGATVGKSLLYLQVRSQNGAYMSWAQAIVRNLTKIYWIPIIFDWGIGKLMKTDRLFNSITKTAVFDELR
ncbi:RDD family protein [uncultured Methanobrevibacter sp.]|uniref:RDD family protein n=1 Tax=uncultured Methanobrevibacter sp. TaxID=253161 RepID=UPI0025E9EB1A|nr:RDD family protein [uncultured Methanobrevibacter sp.]MCI6994513.1 RDD family protein [Methanobrevibacter sp.]